MGVTEQELNELAQRLGERAEQRIDVEETAAAVVGRLRESSEHQSTAGWRGRAPVAGALAAAAAFVLAVGILAGNPDNQLTDSVALARTPVELQTLSLDELEEVYDSLSFDAPVSELSAPGLDDMSIGQLEELLQTLMED